MQIDGATETKEEDEDNIYFIFELEELSEILYAHTQYEVPAFNLDHDVDFRIQIVEGLDKIPEYEEGNNGSNDNDDKNEKDEKDKKNEKDGKDLSNGKDGKDVNNIGNEKKVNNVKDKNNDGEEENDSLEKPAFGSNVDNGESGGSKTGGKQTNPQTGDYSSIIVYSLLLIGSSLFLTFQIKRRLV